MGSQNSKSFGEPFPFDIEVERMPSCSPETPQQLPKRVSVLRALQEQLVATRARHSFMIDFMNTHAYALSYEAEDPLSEIGIAATTLRNRVMHEFQELAHEHARICLLLYPSWHSSNTNTGPLQ